MAINTDLSAATTQTATTTTTNAAIMPVPDEVIAKPAVAKKRKNRGAGYKPSTTIPGASSKVSASTATQELPAASHEMSEYTATTTYTKKAKNKKKERRKRSKIAAGVIVPADHYSTQLQRGLQPTISSTTAAMSGNHFTCDDPPAMSIEDFGREAFNQAMFSRVQAVITAGIESNDITNQGVPLTVKEVTSLVLKQRSNTSTAVTSDQKLVADNLKQSSRSSAIFVSKKTKLYQIKPAAGKGQGMFATQNIPRGARILQEGHIFILPIAEERLDAPRRFLSLSPSERAAYLSLAVTPNRQRDAVLTQCIEKLPWKYPHMVTNLPVKRQLQIMAILETNSFGIPKPGSWEIGESAIFVNASRMNHSCMPNVFFCWNHNINKLTVHAMKDIAAGEEILANYVNICAYKDHRHESLRPYGFTCDCKACDLSTDHGKTSEKNRRRLCSVNRKLFYSHLYPNRYNELNEDWKWSNEQEMIDLLLKEGITNLELSFQ